MSFFRIAILIFLLRFFLQKKKEPFFREFNARKDLYDLNVQTVQSGLADAGCSADRVVKPKESYHKLIRDALNDSSTGYMSLLEIYAWVQRRYTYYADRDEPDAQWKNSIRQGSHLNVAHFSLSMR